MASRRVVHSRYEGRHPRRGIRALAGLAALLDEHLHLPVVTWAGGAADIPRLRAAAARYALPGLAETIAIRHLDAYMWVLNNLRLPILSLRLKKCPATSASGHPPR
jgi:hypothetical protein